MTTLSTHDTKRSEDVRARLLAVAGDAETLAALLARRSRAAADAARRRPARPRTCCGRRWSGSGSIAAERLHDYLVKAMREAKQRTSWIDADEDYEARVLALADRAAGPRRPARRWSPTAVDGTTPTAIRATVLGREAAAAEPARRPRHLPGLRGRRPLAGRPRQPPPGRLRRAARPAGPAATSGAGAVDLDDEKLLITRGRCGCAASPGGVRRGRVVRPAASTSEHALGFVRSAPSGCVASALGSAGRPGRLLVTRAPHRLAAARRLGRRHRHAARGAVARRAHRARLHGGAVAAAPTCSPTCPVALLVSR